MNRYSASANNIGGFNCYGKKQPETMTGVGLPMKKLRPLLALVVPLFLLVSMPPLLLTRGQAQQEEGNDIWRLTMVVTDVPSNIPSIVLEVYKGSGFQAQSLSSPVVDVEGSTATGTVDVSTNDIGGGDFYSVCYQGQYADGNDDAHAYCSDVKIHHGENGHITLSASYGETM
jgi:hypothetical protein